MLKKILLATAAVAAVAALSACGTDDGGGSTDSKTVEGSISLVSGAYTHYDPCHGTSGQIMSRAWDYADMTGGTPVRVLDADGTVLGSDVLSEGDYHAQICTFRFNVPLDDTSDRYQLVVGTRPPFDFKAGDKLNLELGGS